MRPSKLITLVFFIIMSFVLENAQASNNKLAIADEKSLFAKKWRHGSEDCQHDSEPAIEVYAAGNDSYILRQSKCLTFEAPFMYLLIGDEKSILLDTGSHSDRSLFPLQAQIKQLLKHHGKTNQHQLMIMHSHSHKDHYGGDEQFTDMANITLFSPKRSKLEKHLNLSLDASPFTQIDLGNRTITVLPTPGHQEEAISLYDSATKWLLTGDTLYPGLIYVKDWQAYQASIALLTEFSQSMPVNAILGGHIEMTSTANKYYDIGSLYQPNERALALSTADLKRLNQQLVEYSTAKELALDKFIIMPMNGVQKSLSNVFRWLAQ